MVSLCRQINGIQKSSSTINLKWSFTIDSSSLTNEKDHHYFLNSADVCVGEFFDG